ncbi:DUF4126 domain-containing protein [Cognatazoarcus halotolerans]|uniref:DUF4126 domain-containing protein n=1 Tax=Cognatazoarcus halotolerans TaxID=2686016 RepID=UPI00135C22CB|nr:DUF4126 domain-containing protein [Cognatazoarcus halotolerans]MCB1901074.1 DUF4126 domain-containing protein [Rhodocyclaceae bacterium]MCP5307770.1 DUF4126 domain-containing protein [Zoogloeaceae bacterium]
MDLDLNQLGASLEGLKPLLDWRDVPVDMASLAALAAGLGWASGLRLYALVFVLGALGRWGGVELPGGLVALTHPLVLGASGLMLVTEFFADKLPWLDSVWDGVHTFIRIPAGAALAAAVVGEQSGAMQLAMGLLGGSLAAGSHFAKAGARAAINTSPEPFSNVATSLGEDALFAGGVWTLFSHPLWFLGALVVFMLLAGLVIVTMWRFVRRLLRPRARVADSG